MPKKSYRLLIVGIGSIGSRHFEAISKTYFNKEIHILDKISAIKKFKKKLNNFKKNKTIYLHKTSKTIPANIDLVIIATNSNVRAKVTQDLINRIKIKFIIFEKFLFQKESDYKKTINKLKKKRISSWVNCQRRMIPFYAYLKKKISSGKIEMKVSGNRWGLSGNSIHFLDLFFYLGGKTNKIKKVENNLENKIYKSKRKGFMDFFGNLSITFLDGSKIIFEDKKETRNSLKISIKNKNRIFDILEKGKIIKLKIKNNNQIFLKNFKNYFTSEISTKIISQILLNKKSFLPRINESSRYHLILLKIFLSHLQKIKRNKVKKCLVT